MQAIDTVNLQSFPVSSEVSREKMESAPRVDQHNEFSLSIDKLAAAMSNAQAKIRAAKKNKENPHYRSKFADLDECWNVAREPLSENGLSVIQLPSSSGKVVRVVTILMHSSGQWIKNTLQMEADGPSPQKIGGAITYARRYAFSAIVGITSEEDDDGNAASGVVEVDRTHEKRTSFRKQQPKQQQPVHSEKYPGEKYTQTGEQKIKLAKVCRQIGIADVDDIIKVSNALLNRIVNFETLAERADELRAILAS